MGQIRRGVFLAIVVVILAAVTPAVAGASILQPIAIGKNATGEPSMPAVAVDSSGNAYIAWVDPNETQMDFCKVALTATGCHPVAIPAPDPGATFFDPPSVFLSGGNVYVFEDMDGGSNNEVVGMDEWISTNGGASFTELPYAISGVNVGDNAPDQNPVIPLPQGDIGIGYNAPGSNPLFQVNSLASPTDYSAAKSPGPFATINAPHDDYTLTNQASQFAAQLSGSLGVLGVFTADEASPSPCPSTSPAALAYAYAPLSATDTASQIKSALDANPGATGSAWSTLGIVDCDGDNPAVSGGPSGFGVLETNETSLLDPLVQYRAFSPTSSTWSGAVTVGSGESVDDSLSQDSGGGIYGTWLDPDTGVTLAYSSTHGASWDGPISLLANDGGALSIGSLASSVDASGAGWAVYAVDGTEYAQPFNAVETIPAPTKPANTGKPGVSGSDSVGTKLTCSPGSWTGSPTLTYQWYRNGVALAGETASTYTVGTIDEGSTFYCVVTATNVAGSASASSNSKKVPIKYTKKCPPATGKMTGTQIGLLKLNMTRKQARYVYRRHSTRGFQYKDFFCLTPEGVRAGYATPKLLKTLAKSERKRYADRVVWASTSDPYYSLDGVRAGESITTASVLLHTLAPLHIGKNYWYLAVKHGYTAVLKVRGVQVQELGIADNSLTKTAADRSTLMHSFY